MLRRNDRRRPYLFRGNHLSMLAPRVIAIANPWAVKTVTSTFRFLANVSIGIVIDMLVLATTSQNPRA